MKYLLAFFCFLMASASAYVYDVEYISPEKRYEIDKRIYEFQMESQGHTIYQEYPHFFKWMQLQEDREKRFFDWLKTVAKKLIPAELDTEAKYYIWSSQNPTKL